MKKTILLICSLLMASFSAIQAQDQKKVVHIKRFDMKYYFSASDSEGEEVETASWARNDEKLTLEIVEEEKGFFQCHIKTDANYYLTIEDDALIVGSKTTPTKTFHFYEEGKFYRIYFNGATGLDINRDGEVIADGSSAGFFVFEDVVEGQEIRSSIRNEPPTREFRITVFTSNGTFTETSSNIGIKVDYAYAYQSGASLSSTSTSIKSGNIGRLGNRSASTSFSLSHFSLRIKKLTITNNGGGINENWKVDWFQLDEKVHGRWEKIERGLMGYWVNKGESMQLTF